MAVVNVVVRPYKSNSVIIINNNVGHGGAGHGFDYSVDVAKYKLTGDVDTYINKCNISTNPLIPIDDASYTNGFLPVDGIYNPYDTDSTNNAIITSLRGFEYSNVVDGIYNVRVGDGSSYICFDITIINNILQCRKQYYDLLLKDSTCDNICNHCNTPKAILKNYLEFNNLWSTIQNYSEYLELFKPQSSLNTSLNIVNITALSTLIDRANTYCVFCDNCKDCK